MTRSQADPDLPSLISDHTSLLIHSPVASSCTAAPVFSSSSISIPAPATSKHNPNPVLATTAPIPLTRAAIGACASAAAGTFTYATLLPIDVVKTRLQAAAAPSAATWQVFLDILHTDGSLSLYRGLSAVMGPRRPNRCRG
ncbi:protein MITOFERRINLIKE 1, chloroplastic [Panicum miliaceum]|uniref:Protein MITOFERRINLIKE 1, chloroplastic n=1 Tax=Panicum miliaceum TaxID=4540 RepID=A0A3L6S8R2_PANMI|nr:protein MITOFERRINLIKE 1, chloroplastic [Panicum miliaceum]